MSRSTRDPGVGGEGSSLGTVSRRDALRITAVAGIGAAFGLGIVRQLRLRRFSSTRTRMGTLVTLTVVHRSSDEARAMVEAGFAEMERLESILSRHRPTAALARLNAGARLDNPPPELVTVLESALDLAAETDGAFDPTVLPLLRVWEAAYSTTAAGPTAGRVEAARELVDFRAVSLTDERIDFERPGIAVTLDGIAKGYIVDRTLDVLVGMGASRVMVDGGGDIATGGPAAPTDPWTVALQDPRDAGEAVGVVRLGGEAVATSGDYQGSFAMDLEHHHILDPRTGRSPEGTSSVSVIAPDATTADALSTAVMVLGPERGLDLLRSRPGTEGLVVDKEGRRSQTPGLRARVVSALSLVAPLLVPVGLCAAGPILGGLTPTALHAQADQPLRSDPPPLFASTELLSMTISADFTTLGGDRRESPDRPAVLTVPRADGGTADVQAEVRTRGESRLDPATCSFPPLRIDVDGASAVGTVLEGQDDLKFVSSCRPGRDSYDELVVKEYLAYRSVQAVTDASLRVRALRVTLRDTVRGNEETRFAFLIEDADDLAARLGARVFDLDDGRRLPPAAFDPIFRMTNALVHYMLGNLDWADTAGHNVEVLELSNVALAIPYDFDSSGVVDAPYAVPPQQFGLRSVTERYYRGWCENPITTREVLDRFRRAREDVLSLWREEPMLSERTRSRAVRYLDEFFSSIETDERAARRFLRDCRRLPGSE